MVLDILISGQQRDREREEERERGGGRRERGGGLLSRLDKTILIPTSLGLEHEANSTPNHKSSHSTFTDACT